MSTLATLLCDSIAMCTLAQTRHADGEQCPLWPPTCVGMPICSGQRRRYSPLAVWFVYLCGPMFGWTALSNFANRILPKARFACTAGTLLCIRCVERLELRAGVLLAQGHVGACSGPAPVLFGAHVASTKKKMAAKRGFVYAIANDAMPGMESVPATDRPFELSICSTEIFPVT